MSESAALIESETHDAPDVEAPTPDESEPGSSPDTPEGDDPQPADQPGEPDVEAPADPQELSDKEIEKAYKAVEKVRETVARRVGDIFGEGAIDLIPCPLCIETAPGFIWNPAVAPLAETVENNMRVLLGMNVRGQFKQHPNAIPCSTCDGLGRVETPSKVPGYDVVECPDCNATGRILTSNVTPSQVVNGVLPPATVLTGPTAGIAELPPEAQALKDAGWIVAPPFNPTPPQV